MIAPGHVYGGHCHLSYDGAHDIAVRAVAKVAAVADCVAVTLAAAWQSPGPRGSVLASIASQVDFDIDDAYDALRDIEDVYDRKAMVYWLMDLDTRLRESLED